MRIEQVIFSSGDRMPMLLDDADLPVAEACDWALSRRHKAFATQSRNMQELLVVHAWARERRFDLYERLRSGRMFTEAEVTSLLERLRRPSANGVVVKLAVSPDTANKRVSTARRHMTWYINELIADASTGEVQRQRLTDMKAKLDAALLAGMQSPEGNPKYRKPLKLAQAQFLQDALDPHGTILFGRDSRGRLRNFLMICLLTFLGLRTGELLSLRIQDIRFGAITTIYIRRRGMSPNDPRRRPPRVKRKGRILPLDSPRIAILLDDYISTERQWCIDHGRAIDSGFVFLSDEGNPLSTDRLSQLFRGLRAAFPEKLPEHLSPHSLRYTFTDLVYEELRRLGKDEDEISQILMYLRGDSSPDSQDTYIDYAARGAEALQRYQSQVASSRNAPDVLL
ncbi:site-specific integrase [Pseudomonas asiatica]|uniref:site-specific integrase n=1 Tax=Pseudomonas asiatica TaxID=2219225 RepID=UPI00209ACB19|nr:site-specific integrase [Pseudomonas asiatica]MCO7534911.1 site-specific integrase [Pseudomonas asiatica]MCO7548064.1 site-specific integrase [Pseudomonas asiatica]MCO7558906.1 site-specific integrase [Pseudomonas asiatica]